MLYAQIYIEQTGAIITSPRQRYAHPVTGVIYGAGDYDDPAKLAELGGIEILTAPDDTSAGSAVQDGHTVTVDAIDGRRVATLVRRWRAFTDDEVAPARERLRAQVNTERDRRLDRLVVTVGGVPYDADRMSRDNLTGLLSAAAAGVPIPWPIPWRCADNAARDLDAVTAAAVAATILGAIQAIYAQSWHLKDTVIPALSAGELAACDVTDDAHW